MQERWPAGQTQRADAHAYQSTAIMTSEAFTTTVTWPLALMPSSSTASLVMDEVIIWPWPISTRTWEVVAPFFTSTTVPLIWLRALMRMMVPSSRARLCRERAGSRIEMKGGTVVPAGPRAYGATALNLSAFWAHGDSQLARFYGLASGAARTWRQAAGNCASVIGGLGFGGSAGGFGWITSSFTQIARAR